MASLRVFRGCRILMAAAAAKSSSTSSSSSAAAAVAPVRKSVGITKPIPVSPAMKNFVGSPEISRAQVIKKVWEYVKHHNLQNPANKKEIVCDDKLKTIFHGKDKVGMLEISGLLNPHFLKSE